MNGMLILLAMCLAAASVAAQAPHRSKPKDPQRVRLYPKFQTGQTLYYQMDFRSRTSGTSEGLIVSPEASTEQEISISALVRLDVISVAPGPSPEARPSVHLRTTYRKVASTIRTDVPDPEPGAVILSAMSLDGTAKHSDHTPPESRAKNLRTHGRMSGNGQSLTYISLESGLVVSVTQTSRQDMDVTVSSNKGGSSLRYQGNVETQWELSLLPVPCGLPSNPPK